MNSHPSRFGIPLALIGAAFLAFAARDLGALPAGPVPLPGQAPRALVAPERGFLSSEPGKTWEQGLLSGNGTIGASVLGRPLDEIIVFSHKRMFVPERDPLLPPATATRLFEIRRLIDRGLYAQAGQLAVDASMQKEFLYPDALMPAFDLRIKMTADGEAPSRITRAPRISRPAKRSSIGPTAGARSSAAFSSRGRTGSPSCRITGPGRGTVDCRLELSPREPDNRRFKADVNNLAHDGRRFNADLPPRLRPRLCRQHPGPRRRGPGRGPERDHVHGRSRPLRSRGADEVLVLVDIKVLDDLEKPQIEADEAGPGRSARRLRRPPRRGT